MCTQRRRTNSQEGVLVERAIQGDRAATGELLYNCSDQLASFINRSLPDSLRRSIGVDDILQETFRVAYRDIQHFQGREDASFLSWLRTIAKHRTQDALRNLGRRKRGGGYRRVEAVGANSAESALDIFDALVGDESTPLRRASRKEALRLMQVALAELKDPYREVLRLRYEEGKSYQEIAEIMGRTVGAVQGLIKRAKQRLRDSLGGSSAYLSSR